jgi:predicted DNA-binding protein (UPF0251 family)
MAIAAALLLLVALPLAGAVADVASAQGGTGTPGTANETFWAAFAARLGISVDDLTAAFKGAAKDTVAQELQAGQITQDQADKYNGRIDSWTPDRGGPFMFPLDRGMERDGREFGMFGQTALDAAAKALGMTADELKTELQSGKTLADIATEKQVDAATVKQAIIDAAKAQVDQAVTDGKLTQAQADEMKASIDETAANLDLTQPFFFGGPGRGHGHGGWGGPFGAPGECPETTPGEQPTTVPTGPAA